MGKTVPDLWELDCPELYECISIISSEILRLSPLPSSARFIMQIS